MKFSPIALIRSVYDGQRDKHEKRQLDKYAATFVSHSEEKSNVSEAAEDAILAIHRLTKGSGGTLYKKYNSEGVAYFTTTKYSRQENRARSPDKYFRDVEEAYKDKRTAAQQKNDAWTHVEEQLQTLIDVSDGLVKERAEAFLIRLTTQCSAPASTKERKAMVAALAEAIDAQRVAA